MAKGSKKEGGGIGELLAYAGDRKFLTYLGMALSAFSQLLGFGPYVCIWFVARDLIAVAPNWSEATDISMYGWWAVGFALASIVVYFVGLMCTHLSAFRCASNIRKATSEHLLKLPLGYFDTHATGELRRIVDGCAASTETLLAHMLPDIAGATAMVVGLLVLLFALDWRLGAACLISVVVSFCAMATMMSGKGAEFMKAYMGALVKMNKTGTEYVRGIPVVKVFQQTVYSFKAFHDAIAEYADMAQSYAGTFCRGPQVLNLTALNGLVAFLLPVALLLAPGETDFAHFMVNFTFYAIFSAVVPTAMTKLMFVGEASQMSADSLARIRSVMDSKQLSVPALPKHPAGSDVRFEDVSFTYEGAEAPAVDHVSFSVPAGSTLALVGPSGGGKSTCASLIPRFWDVSSGRVLVGGVDVRDMDPHELMDQVAFVFQTNQLFRQTLADNVRASKPGATDDEVRAALSAAQCDDIVAKLPQGIDTMLGAGGAYLSGGEVQRVSLARAILKDAPIVVLDEATAFADPENEALIQRAFSKLAAGRTVIMIAHRLSTVVGANKIVVLNQGGVQEAGTHAELLSQNGLYAKMWAEYEQAASWKITAAAADVAAAKGGEAKMFASFQKKYFLSDKGIAGVKRGVFWTALTNLITMAGMGFLFLVMAGFVEHLASGADLPDALPIVGGLLVFFVLLFASNWQQYYYTYCIFYEECGKQRMEIAERLRKLPLSFFGRRDLADLTETIMGDVQTMEHAYSHVLGELWGAIIASAIVFVSSLFFCWQLAIAAFWSIPVAFAVLYLTRGPMTPVFDRVRAEKVKVTEAIQETLDCVREIRATNQEAHYLEGLNAVIDAEERETTKGELANGLLVNSAFAILRLGIATTLVTGAAMVASGQVDFLVMFAFLLMVSRIYAPFDQALMLMSELFAAESSAKRMRSIMEEPVARGSEQFEPVGHDVVFDHVAFGYGAGEDGRAGEKVLTDVSFTAKEGEVTALVGPSGSGKSTVSRLAARFWDATAGTVTVGGVDVASVDPEVLLRDYAIVFQDVLLFDDTVMGNIRLGRRGATDEQVLAAARAANCDEFVSRMPQGYNTMIGENGSKLSGGERQRISIARALLKDAPIVLLDEATASLDVENETVVQQALSRLLAGKTVIVIAHRMRTVENADKIVVLMDGVVAEQGTPAQLKAAGGEFARMVALQKEAATWQL